MKLETIADTIGIVGLYVAILTFFALVLRLCISVYLKEGDN